MGDRTIDDATATTSETLWPMGAVTRRTGISEHTLRAWERRFGFPKPIRLASGHRRFTDDQVHKLKLINLALSRGYRAGNVVPLEEAELEVMIRNFDSGSTAQSDQGEAQQWSDSILADALAFRAREIESKIATESASLGARRFLRDRCVPLVESLGQAWVDQRIDINHEHLVSQILESHLRSLRAPFQAAALPPPVVMACLPDEAHSLGLHMAALEITVGGRQTLVLGLETPIDQIVSAAVSARAAAAGLSVSVSADEKTTRLAVDRLSESLPEDIELWLGGQGSLQFDPLPSKVRRMASLDDLALAVRTLVP